jgi:hypothetical protein
LILRPGADITLAPEANLLAYGGLIAVGAPEQRIRIHGDSSGEPWGVFGVVRSPGEVVVEYVDFSGGSQAQINGILFTGGFAVYDSPLRVAHSTFVNMQSEDGFNLKNGAIFMDDCLVEGNAIDGVDLDFVTGEVRNSRFLNNVNDGLDISGSTVKIVDNHFEGNGDKGLSVGEDSHPVIINALFLRNNLGASFKDLSHARLAYATFADNVVAIEAKRKKPFFGGGSGEVVNSVFVGNQTLLDEDYFSADQVSIERSLADDGVGCRTCNIVDIRFQAAAQGDYQLSGGSPAGFSIAKLTWPEAEGVDTLPEAPGVFLSSD